MTALAIQAHGLTRKQGSFLLDHIDLQLPTGYVLGFVGPNGAGKTTTIKTILGMITPDSGDIQVLGHEPSSSALQERIGMVLDRPFFSPEWKVNSLSRRVGRFYTQWDDRRYADLLAQFGINGTQRVGDLSRGQGMKLSIAVALSHDPELLVLDEPTSGLDPVSRSELTDILRSFMTDDAHSVMLSTHITADLDGLADYIHVINAGRTAFYGSLDDLHDQFAAIHGIGDLAPDAARAVLGLRHNSQGFEGLIRMTDSHLFDSSTEFDPATTDDVVVHLARTNREEIHS
jgi:ABC-2 type transport system ATP-binding protein